METFFTKKDYQNNYERLKNEFIEAYVDNDETEFIAQQIKWYEACRANTVIEVIIWGGAVIEDTLPSIKGEGIVGEVDTKIRKETGSIDPTKCQNFNVSFRKIIEFLREKKKGERRAGPSATQWALYHYTLQKCKIRPMFQNKKEEFAELSTEYGKSHKNLEMRYNKIINSEGQEGYTEADAAVVESLLAEKHPEAIPIFNDLTKQLF